MFGIVTHLFFAAAVGLVDGPLHRSGDRVGIQNRLTVNVPRGTADRLDQRALRAQEPFLVGIQDRDQGNLGHVEAFPQQVDAHQHIERPKAQVTNDLGALHRADIRMQVTNGNTVFAQVIGQVLGHAFR